MMRSHNQRMDYLKSSYTLFIIFTFLVKDIAALTVSVTQDPVGILGNNTVNLVCTYSPENNDVVYTITWQKKQTDTYSADDNIATFWPPVTGRNASFSTSTNPGKDLVNRSELIDPTSTQKTAVLKINEIKCKDETEYRCIVDYFKDGTGSTSESATTSMTVRARPSNPDSVPAMNPDSNIVENTDVDFTCTGDVGRNPNGTFVWYKYVNNVLKAQWNGQQTNTLIDGEGKCTFNGSSSTTVRVARDDNMMVIRCAIEQTGAGNTYFRQTEQIRVFYGVNRRPDITRDPSDSAIIAGRTVTLTCKADGNPLPSYKWYDSNSNEIGNGDSYQIQNAQPSDSGTYTCMAYNTFPFGSNQSFNQNASVLINIVLTTPAPTTTTTTVPSTSAGQITTPTAQPQDPEAGGLSTGALVAIIVVLVIVVIVVVALLVFCFIIKPRRQRDDIDEPPEKPRNNQDMSLFSRPDIVNNDPNNKFSPFNNQQFSPNKGDLAYADLQFDDRPRSRKPIQLYDPGPNAPYSEVTMPSV